MLHTFSCMLDSVIAAMLDKQNKFFHATNPVQQDENHFVLQIVARSPISWVERRVSMYHYLKSNVATSAYGLTNDIWASQWTQNKRQTLYSFSLFFLFITCHLCLRNGPFVNLTMYAEKKRYTMCIVWLIYDGHPKLQLDKFCITFIF
jgi:hypothetical protein